MAGACEDIQSFMPIMALLKEVTIRFSVAYSPNEFRKVVEAFETRLIDPSPLLGPTMGLSQVADAFELVRTSATQGRVLVIPDP
jgi:(R,R)-butanediol dehydrogenase/meso-butanediol dehydrogenase/diacetyl reductase